jgi:alpha-L-fucosidase 2
MNHVLWYQTPAEVWKAGLPIGTGRIAAMVLGWIDQERISLNHEWLWRGKNQTRDTKSVEPETLKKIRQLLLSGEFEEGTLQGNIAFGGGGGFLSKRSNAEKLGLPHSIHRVDPFQPAGDLRFTLDHGPIQNYKRELNLETAVVEVSYDTNIGKFSRKYIAHPLHDLIIIQISGPSRGLSGTFELERIEDAECTLFFSSESMHSQCKLIMDGFFQEGIDFRIEASIQTRGGSWSVSNERVLEVKNAEEIIIFINLGTSAKKEAPVAECARYPIPQQGWTELLQSHVNGYKTCMSKLQFQLGIPGNHLPTDQRVERVRQGLHDPGLALLYFYYGRYLVFASSHTAELPPNLQGKWNEELQPPWESDYHHDINLQFSYWPIEPAHLQQYAMPLLTYVERMIPRARKAAKDLYGCRGVLFPIQTDCWGRPTPESFGYSVWIGAAAWLGQHLWWHYEYSQDLQVLRNRIYPFIKEVAAFYEDYLIRDKHGVLQVVPSQSPENKFVGGGILPVTLCVSSAMDIQFIQETLKHAIQASALLDLDEKKRDEWRRILQHLPPLRIGSQGQLLEWDQEYEEVHIGHRHLSHLIGLYPGDLITQEETPELFVAGKVSLERRLSDPKFNGRLTRAWVACMYARMGEGELAMDRLNDSIVNFAPNDDFLHTDIIHAVPAAVCEMLLHSYHEKLRFLPALPASWPEGKITGLRARGGYTVDIEWREHRLHRARVVCVIDRTCEIKTTHEEYEILDSSGEGIATRIVDNTIQFAVRAGEYYSIKVK